MVEYLGGDPSPGPWFWCELGEKYPELTEPAFEYFRAAREGNPAYGIALLARYCGLDPERAVAALQELRLGDPGWAIYLLARYCGLDLERAFAALQELRVDPLGKALAIAELANHCGLDKN